MSDYPALDRESEFMDAYNVAYSLFNLLSCSPSSNQIEDEDLVKIGAAGFKAIEEAKEAFYGVMDLRHKGGTDNLTVVES